MTKQAFLAAGRQETEFDLQVIDGQLPDDLQGYIYLNSPAGTVNSGLPYPKLLPDGSPNPEYGNPVFNGDGYVFKFDMNTPGVIKAKTALLKTPCYYADEATKLGTAYYQKGQQFKQMGISRESFTFGVRNQINTAINPFQFEEDNNVRLTANFDAGRPWEFDPNTLELKTPIGKNSDWTPELPDHMQYVFRMHQATAHPAFDPHTKEYFTVNFTKDYDILMGHTDFHEQVQKNPAAVERAMARRLSEITARVEVTSEEIHEELRDFHRDIRQHVAKEKGTAYYWWHLLLTVLEAIWQFFLGIGEAFAGKGFPVSAVFLLRWTGKDQIDKWKVIDEATQQPIDIIETMHQTNLCKDYIVLIDAALKFSLDIIIKNPFPHNETISRIIRDITAKTLLPYTPVFLIKRSDLDPNKDTVTAKQLTLDIETVHFSLDYDNPNGQITFHGAHNCANCAAEWVRSYDFLPAMGGSAVHENTIGILTTGEMDIGRIGKFVIDGDTGDIVEQTIICEKGFPGDTVENLTAHTWAVGLHTYRGIISPTEALPKLTSIYWQSYGLDARFLTSFIESLYADYKNRIIPVEDLINYNQQGIPFVLMRQDVATMTLPDWYVFEKNHNFRSLQFVPRRSNGNPTGVDWDKDGYIFCTMVNGSPDFSIDEYTREIWIFDANNLKGGPLCKLSHPDLSYAFTIHSTWIPESVSQPNTYKVNIEEDYNEVIQGFKSKSKQAMVQAFMNKNVYPYFND